jgi:hypothetical protein
LDVLKVKRRDHELEISSPEENSHQNTKKKIVTKVAVAKKILKKKIIANKKTLFNDEGEVCTQNVVVIVAIISNVAILFHKNLYCRLCWTMQRKKFQVLPENMNQGPKEELTLKKQSEC